MVKTIQVNERTLELLKRLKEQMQMFSYDETINKLVSERGKNGKSQAGSLKKYLGKQSIRDILKELQDERRRSDRI